MLMNESLFKYIYEFNVIGGLNPGTSHASSGFPHVIFWGCDSLVSQPLVIVNLVLKRFYKTRL